jgi:hypothetical protein
VLRCNRIVTRTAAVLGVLAATLALASVAEAAAPNYILVSGPRLSRPVLLGDWNENLRLLIALVEAPKASRSVARGLAHRPRFDLAEFWGWGSSPPPTRPSQANQHGWFYPAYHGRRAFFDLRVDGLRVPRTAPAQAVEILARHGVPTRL